MTAEAGIARLRQAVSDAGRYIRDVRWHSYGYVPKDHPCYREFHDARTQYRMAWRRFLNDKERQL